MSFAIRTAALLALIAGEMVLGAPLAEAGFAVTYLGAGVEMPSSSATCGGAAGCQVGYDTFNYVTQAQAAAGYTSNYSSGTGVASPFTGVYSPFLLEPADQYGGAGGVGTYPVTYGYSTPPSYSVTLTNTSTGGGANYFGLWISALDGANQLQFYGANGNLLYTFSAQLMVNALGSCAGGNAANAYCGNPSDWNADSGELFAYVNFFDIGGSFSKVVFTETGNSGGGFESDNQAVSYIQNLNNVTTGTLIPEPASLGLLGAGLVGLHLARRRPLRAS